MLMLLRCHCYCVAVAVPISRNGIIHKVECFSCFSFRSTLQKPSDPLMSAKGTFKHYYNILTLYRRWTNLSRAPRSSRLGVHQPGGILPIIRQLQPVSVTLHLGSVLSVLREARPPRRSLGVPPSGAKSALHRTIITE